VWSTSVVWMGGGGLGLNSGSARPFESNGSPPSWYDAGRDITLDEEKGRKTASCVVRVPDLRCCNNVPGEDAGHGAESQAPSSIVGG
jgi:hypothetical protein